MSRRGRTRYPWGYEPDEDRASNSSFQALENEQQDNEHGRGNRKRPARQSVSQERQFADCSSVPRKHPRITWEDNFGTSANHDRYRQNHQEGRGRSQRRWEQQSAQKRPFPDSPRSPDHFTKEFRNRGAGTFKGRGRSLGRGFIPFGHENGQREVCSSHGPPERRAHVMSFKQIDDLHSKEPSDIILSLVEPRSGLQERLARSSLEPDLMVRLLKVLARALKSNIHPKNQHYLMGILLESNLFKVHVPMTVTAFMTKKDEQNVFENLAVTIAAILKRMPVVAAENLNDCSKLCCQILRSQSDPTHVPEAVKKAFLDIENGIQHILDKKIKHAHELLKAKSEKEVIDDEPPDDFRKIPIAPFIDEITTNMKPFLRKNIVDGSYKNTDHYLDVQFRLLREDFVAPLRQGINDYLHQHLTQGRKKGRIREIRVYEGVKILDPICTRDGIHYEVSFDTRPLKRIRWEATRRLMSGSLVCFSADDFKTVRFATVTLRNPDKLKCGVICVKFEGEFDELLVLSNEARSRIYVMAESQAYFEAYRHILKGLQMVNSETLPLTNYIVYIQKRVEPPKYLDSNSVYEMASILVKPCKNTLRKSHTLDYKDFDECNFQLHEEYKTENGENNAKVSHHTNVLNLSSWPSNDELDLDDSQKRALHLALTSSLAIIQGPPGTGKTFIGLKIVKTLLSNRNIWKTCDAPAPILVVCLTNHALDQFLIGILPFTKKLIRVGGRSKNDILDQYNIRCIRDHLHSSRLRAANIHFNTKDLQWKLRGIRSNIEKEREKIHLLTTRVLHEDALDKLTNDDQRLVRSLKDNFEEVLGINPDYQPWCPNSFLAAWLGLTCECIVSKVELDEFYNNDEENFQETGIYNQSTEEQSGLITLSEAGFVEAQPVDDDLIEIEDGEIFDHQNRWLEEEIAEVEPLSIPGNACAWAVDLEKPSDLYLTLPPDLASMLHTSRLIAERELRKTDSMSDGEVAQQFNAWTLTLADRWRLYRRWIALFRAASTTVIITLQANYSATASRLKEVMNGEELTILRNSDIVGMTTTGAAKYHQVLQEMGSKIVIVEEAAEVLESHIVTTLSPQTEHLVLIGDHMQLRPTTAVYKLAREYHLDVSLFERMIKNGVDYQTLQLQHRMRPEVSRLIVPLIYPNLEDHASVHCYPNIRGVSTNVFFVNHSSNEEAVVDSMTHTNQFEAEFLIGLCYYLLQQGYDRDKITILTTYTGQLFALRKLMKKDTFEGIRVTVVDNYQGEENDIILLSFVRSNEEGKIGFIRETNRANVALSRARHGLYCVGNFSFFARHSDFWRKLVANLESDERIGSKLKLKCPKHPENQTQVSFGNEFSHLAPEGGCLQSCLEIQSCGHVCQRVCHLDAHLKCNQQCTKLCTLNHQCPLLCHEVCQPCKEMIMKRFPTCQHSVLLPCHRDISEVKCKEQVMKQFPTCQHSVLVSCYREISEFKCEKKVVRKLETCGHEATLRCHINPRTYECVVEVERILTLCKHQRMLECHLDPDEASCLEECDYRLDCGHRCPRKCHPADEVEHVEILCYRACNKKICELDHKCQKYCYQPCGKCRVSVEKKLPCGHKDNVACWKNVADIVCGKNCERTMDCGHLCKLKCKDPCGQCREIIKKKIPKCGHEGRMLCMDNPDAVMCREKCDRLLACGHRCKNKCCDPCTQTCKHSIPVTGLCGHASSVPCHTHHYSDIMVTLVCQAPCTTLLPCEHKCRGTCGDCRQGRLHVPCLEKCGRVQICGHQCQTPCSEACMPCTLTCETRCVHSRCPKRCGQPCKRCWENCSWLCHHHKCKKYCWEFCKRPRCNKPCRYKLRCGHPCIGLCKERCPKLCRICNHDELTEFILFGYEDEEDARFIQLKDCDHCIEVQALDHYMDMDQDEIQMKGCPRCKTTIWRSHRYGNIIRQRMEDVQKVKKQLYGSNKTLRQTMNRLQNMLETKHGIRKNFQTEFFRLENCLKLKFTLHHNELAAIENQINILQLMVNIKDKVQKMTAVAIEYFNVDVKFLCQRLMKNKERMTEDELNQIRTEVRRLLLRTATVDTEKHLAQREHNLEASENLSLAKKILDDCCKLSLEEEKKIETALETALQLPGGLGISENERVEIVQAMGFTPGHWYKCPNGHVYAIADCGGAMEIGKCNECGSKIGGQRHNLLSDNAHAGEMDGSRHAAWSEGANMVNYRL